MQAQTKAEIWKEWQTRAKRDDLVHTSHGIIPKKEFEELKNIHALKVLKEEKIKNNFLGEYTFYDCTILRDYPVLCVTTSKGEERWFDEDGSVDRLEERKKELGKSYAKNMMTIQYLPRAYTQYLEKKREYQRKVFGAEQYNRQANETLKNVLDVFKKNIDVDSLKF